MKQIEDTLHGDVHLMLTKFIQVFASVNEQRIVYFFFFFFFANRNEMRKEKDWADIFPFSVFLERFQH